jgi:hypothetical protein
MLDAPNYHEGVYGNTVHSSSTFLGETPTTQGAEIHVYKKEGKVLPKIFLAASKGMLQPSSLAKPVFWQVLVWQ